jgi:hypothetical protein
MNVRIGPFAFTFLSDGDDPGTGIVLLETDAGYRSATNVGVSRVEWDAFVTVASVIPRLAQIPKLFRPIDTLEGVTREIAAAQAKRDRSHLKKRRRWWRRLL